MNVKSTLLMIILGVSASSVAMAADDGAKDPAVFQAAKERHIANLQERLQIVQTHLSCVQAAQDSAAMKVCKETAKQQASVLEAKIKSEIADKKAKKN